MGADTIALELSAWLATYALHSTALIATAGLAAALLARVDRWRDVATGLRERMWKLALIGGIATATAQTWLSIDTWRFDWSPAEAPVEVVAFDAPVEPEAEAVRPAVDRWTVANPIIAPALMQLRVLGAAPKSEPQLATPHTAAATTPDRPIPWIEVGLGLWLAGIVIGLCLWAREWRRLFICLRGRVSIESGLVFRDLESLRRKAGCARRVRLSCAPGIAVPITMGFLRAEICLPPRALRALQRDEIRAVLAHELAHAVRHDTAWLCLCRLLEIVFFFQPLNRIARRYLQEDVESLCDDWAVVHTGECVPLASSLTEIAGWIVGEHRRLPAPAMVVHGSGLSTRVRRLLDEERTPVLLRGHIGLTAIAALCCAGAAWALPGVATSAQRDHALAIEDSELTDAYDSTLEQPTWTPEPSSFELLTPTAGRLADAAPAFVLANAVPAPTAEQLDFDTLREEIAGLEQSLDALQAEVTLTGATELQPQLDALLERLDTLREMRVRLGELLQLDQPLTPNDQP